MDKFVVRTPRPKQERPPPKKDIKFKQLKVKDLGRVVVVEDILRHKAVLKAGADHEAVLESLGALDALSIPVNTLVDTRVGTYVRKLTSHTNPAICAQSRQLMNKWSEIILAPPRPLLDVERGGKDEKIRRAHREHLLKGLRRHRFVEVEGEKGAAGTVDLDQVVRRIDNLVFDSVHKRRISPMYRSCMRDYYYVFKRNKSVCQAVYSGILDADQLVQLGCKKLSKWEPP